MTKKSGNILCEIGNRTPFSVPQGYFEQFAENILPFVLAQNNRSAKTFKMRRWIAAAATVAVLISVGFLSYRSYGMQQISENQDNYETYLMSQIDDNNLMEYYFTSYEE